jgi:site-specific recombinase XerD
MAGIARRHDMRTLLPSAVSGPLAPYAEAFAQRLREQGYAPWTLQDKLHVVARLSDWLAERQLPVGALDEQRICGFLHEFHACERRRYHGDPTTLRDLLRQLSDEGVLPQPTAVVEDGPQAAMLRAFRCYLIQERGLALTTVDTYVAVAGRFLATRFGTARVDPATLRAHDVIAFVRAEAHRLSPKPAQLMVSALRGFLRFLHQHGRIAVDLSASVPTVADWRRAGVPKYLPAEQVETLLACCDQRTVAGQRDYAVLLLLARLGLRAGEVVHLHLEDVDWSEGLLTVCGKGGRWRRLPLPVDVGEAIAGYLRSGRPPCSTRRVFVRLRAPHTGFAASVAIDGIVSRALTRAGLQPPLRGAHLLRHSLATTMLRRGASLAEIGQLLGHRLPQTTEIYAKVDACALSELAQPWPGATS